MPGPAFAALAAAINRNIPSDRAAELLVAYRKEARAEAEQEKRAELAAAAEELASRGVALDQLTRTNEALRGELADRASETADAIEALLGEFESGGVTGPALGRALAALIRDLRTEHSTA